MSATERRCRKAYNGAKEGMKEMILKSGGKISHFAIGVGSLVLFLAALCFWAVIDNNSVGTESQAVQIVSERISIQQPSLIDYSRIDKNAELRDLMKTRKSQYGVDAGVDMIAKSEETLKVGNSVVPMKEIVNKIRLNQLQVIQDGLSLPTEPHPDDAYGIYVVKPGDSIWKIHYNLLRGYFEQQGVKLAWWSDEPLRNGKSSGVARILKYSESMVSIYNVKERKVETNLNHLETDSKIAVFNITQTLERFRQIDYQHLNSVRFNGKNLIIPAER